MKFNYSNITYVVFADRQEIQDNSLLIKVEDNYLQLHPISYADLNLFNNNLVLQDFNFTKLTTTEVLKHFSNDKQILLAHEVREADIDALFFTSTFFTGKVEDIIEKLEKYRKCKFIENSADHLYLYRCVSVREETEQEVLDRVRCKADYEEVKYFNP